MYLCDRRKYFNYLHPAESPFIFCKDSFFYGVSKYYRCFLVQASVAAVKRNVRNPRVNSQNMIKVMFYCKSSWYICAQIRKGKRYKVCYDKLCSGLLIKQFGYECNKRFFL